jgi:hypothetical protein
MVKLVISEFDESTIDKIANRKVCDVVEYDMDTLLGPMKAWKGSVEEEYFSLIFADGIVSLAINGQEMMLGSEATNIAMAEELHEANLIADNNYEAAIQLIQDYRSEKFYQDCKEILFDDICKLLNWTKKPDMKYHKDLLLN